ETPCLMHGVLHWRPRILAGSFADRAPGQSKQGEQAEYTTSVERGWCAKPVPQQSCRYTGQQHGGAADQAEDAKDGTPQIAWASVGHHSSQQTLSHTHMKAP